MTVKQMKLKERMKKEAKKEATNKEEIIRNEWEEKR
jgi:hypothetical protein